jgi:hypothetical protein
MIRLRDVLVDSVALLSLCAALTLVFWYERHVSVRKSSQVDPPVKIVETVEEERAPEPPPRELRLAVTTCVDAKNDPQYREEKHVYDEMGHLLEQLGGGYRYTTITLTDLEDAEKIQPYDVIFLACSLHPNHWHDYSAPIRKGIRPGTQSPQFDARLMAHLRENLHNFVQRGGTLYASDFHFEVLFWTFPEFFEGTKLEEFPNGEDQTVQAEVEEEGLRERLGPSLTIRFDRRGWLPAMLHGSGVTTYLSGEFKTVGGGRLRAPLLVKAPVGQGTLFFTSFHNEKQTSQSELDLLKYLVFTTVTAQEAARVERMMVSGGFSPQKSGLLSASPQDPSLHLSYRSREPGHLRFILGFRPEGARLRLTVVGPDGMTVRKEGSSTFDIEVADAAAGEWRYTVTPLTIPYPNYPFTLNVGRR